MLKGVLFDFDGVVVDSSEAHFNAWSAAFYDLFEQKITYFPKNCEGKSPMHIAKSFVDIVNAPDRAEELYHKKESVLNQSKTPPKLMRGAKLWELYLSNNNIPYGIASNATKQFLLNSVNQLDLNFKTIFGFEDYDKPKPAPEAYIKLATALGFKQNEFSDLLVFEDSCTGISAAKEAGMKPMGILTSHSKEQLLDAGSLNVYTNLADAFYDVTKGF